MEHEFTLLQQQFPHHLAEDNDTCRDDLIAIYTCLIDIFEQVVRIGQTDGSMPCVPSIRIPGTRQGKIVR